MQGEQSKKQKPLHFFYSDKQLKGKRKKNAKILGTVCVQDCTAMSPCTKRGAHQAGLSGPGQGSGKEQKLQRASEFLSFFIFFQDLS